MEYLCCLLLKTPYRILLSDNARVCPVLLAHQIWNVLEKATTEGQRTDM